MHLPSSRLLGVHNKESLGVSASSSSIEGHRPCRGLHGHWSCMHGMHAAPSGFLTPRVATSLERHVNCM